MYKSKGGYGGWFGHAEWVNNNIKCFIIFYYNEKKIIKGCEVKRLGTPKEHTERSIESNTVWNLRA